MTEPAARDDSAHDWHLADAEAGAEVRRLDPDHYQLRYPDGTVEDLTAAEWDAWRGGGSGG